jgi:hypothetical protein
MAALSSSLCTGACLPGSYSLLGASACTLCPGGFRGASGGLTVSTCSGA